ncbi:MAG: tRNA lysidine(34) synthetase TilS [Glaciecola sp.]
MEKHPSQSKAQLPKLIESAIEAVQSKNIIIALSGGIDSVVLLQACYQQQKKLPSALRASLFAIHINHGISNNSAHWQQFCEDLCESLAIPLTVCTLNLSKQKQMSLEAQARESRYAAINQYVLNNFTLDDTLVMTGQHQQDQAETFLLQLKRGAGIKGLASMPYLITNSQGVQYCRPFLHLPKADIEDYAKQYNLQWVEDESNTDQKYDRNFVRQSIMPMLRQKWPHIDKAIVRSATHCADAQMVIEEYMQVLALQVLTDTDKASVTALQALSVASQRSFLRYWLSQHNQAMPSSAQLNDLVCILHPDARSTAVVYFSHVMVEKSQSFLFVCPIKTSIPKPFELDFFSSQGVEISHEYTLLQQPINEQDQSVSIPKDKVWIKYGASNMRAKFDDKRPSKSLKVWYQNWQIPPEQRRNVPVLVHNEQVIALVLPALSGGMKHNKAYVPNDASQVTQVYLHQSTQ